MHVLEYVDLAGKCIHVYCRPVMTLAEHLHRLHIVRSLELTV